MATEKPELEDKDARSRADPCDPLPVTSLQDGGRLTTSGDGDSEMEGDNENGRSKKGASPEERTRIRRRLSSKLYKGSSPTSDSDIARLERQQEEQQQREQLVEKRSSGDGSSKSDDEEAEELARLRCTSLSTEVVAEREQRRRERQRRCPDYPGLSFGSSVYSSDTLMKLSLIKNELHNILNSQLKRAESEVAALNRRIQLLEEDLERSEERLATATAKLAEASQAADESERIRKALENRTNMEDDRVGSLESQLAQAKLIAEESDKKYEECLRLLS
ncbi:tropomyosin isoform X16 [Cimex lectularius]|uniref:Tropomyosin n=1 Tax=Cimex lectularius TaxID=79782 RepID=A0A8I6S1V2_CIMLE|nr:tropomyosin isoform X16 [Cimex lectularius]